MHGTDGDIVSDSVVVDRGVTVTTIITSAAQEQLGPSEAESAVLQLTAAEGQGGGASEGAEAIDARTIQDDVVQGELGQGMDELGQGMDELGQGEGELGQGEGELEDAQVAGVCNFQVVHDDMGQGEVGDDAQGVLGLGVDELGQGVGELGQGEAEEQVGVGLGENEPVETRSCNSVSTPIVSRKRSAAASLSPSQPPSSDENLQPSPPDEDAIVSPHHKVAIHYYFSCSLCTLILSSNHFQIHSNA